MTYRLEAWCHRHLPRTAWADHLVTFLQFYNFHRRLPRDRQGSLNDALYWIKTSGQLREPGRVETSDKELVKDYIRRTVGDTYNVPTLAILRDARSARAFSYPDVCVIKPTHMSGEVIYRRNGEPLDLDRVGGWFERNYYEQWREQNYRNLAPKVIVEPLLLDSMQDFRVFCVNGEPKVLHLGNSRRTGCAPRPYSLEWEPLPFALGPRPTLPADPPASLGEMLAVATRLSLPFNIVRVDFYTDGRQVCVGELTHCHAIAQERFHPPSGEWDFAQRIFGPRGFRRSDFTSKRRFTDQSLTSVMP